MEKILVILEKLHYLNHPILSSLSAFTILFLGIFVLKKDGKSALFRNFFFVCLSLFIWFFGNSFSMFYFDNFAYSAYWFKIAYSGVPFLAISYYNFCLAMVGKKSKLVLPFFIISALEVAYLWIYNINPDHVYALFNVGVIWIRMDGLGYSLAFGMVKYIILTALTSAEYYKAYKREKNFLKKKQLKFLFISFSIFILGSIEWLVTFGIPLHLAWMLIPPFVGLIAYSISRYKLLDINVVIKKTLLYTSGIALISGFIVSISLLSDYFTSTIPGFRLWVIPLISGSATFVVGRIFWLKSKEAEKLKYEFITIAAHKLRTPLTEIKWAASALEEDGLENNERRKLIKEIVAADNKLIDLTNELLMVSKEETYGHKYNLEAVDLEKIARIAVNAFQIEMKEKNIKLIYNAERNLPKVMADKIRMGSVIQTLIENAINYTKDKIKVSIDVYKGDVILHVEDNGIGIKKDDQPYIFFKFYRSHEAYLSETEGTGIGLFLAKSIIEKHNGKIGVRSEGKGKGSVFWFSLPIVK